MSQGHNYIAGAHCKGINTENQTEIQDRVCNDSIIMLLQQSTIVRSCLTRLLHSYKLTIIKFKSFV